MKTLAIWEPGTASELIDHEEGWESLLEVFERIEEIAAPLGGAYYFWVVDTNIAGTVRDLKEIASLVQILQIPDLRPCCLDNVWREIEELTRPLNRNLH